MRISPLIFMVLMQGPGKNSQIFRNDMDVSLIAIKKSPRRGCEKNNNMLKYHYTVSVTPI